MTAFNLEDSASHNLTAQEIVIRMIDYDEPASNLYYQTVLDRRVNKLQQEYKRAAEQGVVPEELQVALDHAKRDCRDALRFNRELCTAAEEIVQGLPHPRLVLLRQWFINDGIVAFTIHSAYHWAKAHGKEVSEWAPPITQILDVDGNRTHSEHVTSEQGVIVLTNSAESRPGTAEKNLRVTLYFLAVALGRLVDKLAEEDRINQPAEQPCINEDASLNLAAISNFVDLRLNSAPDRDLNSHISAGSPDVAPAETHEIFLAILADIMAQLADQAQAENWIEFQTTGGEINRRPFQKNHQFVSSRMYNHLLEVGLLEKYTPNQGKSSVLHKLNDAKKVLASTAIPQYSPAHILSVLGEAQLSYQDSLVGD